MILRKPALLFCKRGHPLGAAARVRPNGAQVCRECQSLRQRAYRRGLTIEQLIKQEAPKAL